MNLSEKVLSAMSIGIKERGCIWIFKWRGVKQVFFLRD